jgi:hypothetical protein
MRNYRLFGVVIAVLLGSSFLHLPPSSPHHHHQQIAGTHFVGTGIQLTSARVSAVAAPTPLALGEESPVGLLQPETQSTLGALHLASTDVPLSLSQASTAGGGDMHAGLLRPAGTRYVKLLGVWMQYLYDHAPPPPPAPVVKAIPAVAIAHPVAAPQPAVAPATAAAGGAASGGAWAGLRKCESGGNYADNTGNGYYGAYQFALGTWHGLGYTGLPSSAPPAVQDQAAQKLQARSGWGQWPACSRRLGLT